MFKHQNRNTNPQILFTFFIKQFILLCACVMGIGYASAQQVTNVQTAQNGDIATITYDLSNTNPAQTYDIKVECVAGNKKPFAITSLALSGDLHEVSPGNNKKIEFNSLNDLKMMVGNNFIFQLVATEIIKQKPVEVKIQQPENNEVEKAEVAFNDDTDTGENADPEENADSEEDPIFIIVEEPATFRGSSLDSFRIWVSQNMLYPLVAAENGIQGKVYVQFVVNKSGDVVMVKVIRNVDPALDAESIRVISSSPKWTPAKQGGRKVNQQFIIPLSFALQ